MVLQLQWQIQTNGQVYLVIVVVIGGVLVVRQYLMLGTQSVGSTRTHAHHSILVVTLEIPMMACLW